MSNCLSNGQKGKEATSDVKGHHETSVTCSASILCASTSKTTS